MPSPRPVAGATSSTGDQLGWARSIRSSANSAPPTTLVWSRCTMRIGRRTDVVPGGPSRVGVTPRAVLAAARRPRRRRHRPSPSKSYAAASTAASYAATSPGGIPNSTVARRASAGTSWRAISDVGVLVLALRIDDVVGGASGGGRLAVRGERGDARAQLLDRIGGRCSIESLGDPAGLPDGERRPQRRRDEPEHLVDLLAGGGEHEIRRPDRLVGDLGRTVVGAVGAECLGDHPRPASASDGRRAPRGRHWSRGPVPRSPAAGTTPPTGRAAQRREPSG